MALGRDGTRGWDPRRPPAINGSPSPQRPAERQHRVRLAVGSGIRPDVWRRFVRRFGPLRIVETYGMSEGNVTLLNYTGTPGAVGRSSFIYKVGGGPGGGWGGGSGVTWSRSEPLPPAALLALRHRALRRAERGGSAGPERAVHQSAGR